MVKHVQLAKVLSFGSKRINSENTPQGEIFIGVYGASLIHHITVVSANYFQVLCHQHVNEARDDVLEGHCGCNFSCLISPNPPLPHRRNYERLFETRC
jgi:hypothetical protein